MKVMSLLVSFSLILVSLRYCIQNFLVFRIVESIGENVDEVTVGDVVIPTFMSDCGDCEDCKSKKSNLCSKLPFKVSPWMPRYETSRFKDINGEVLYHFLFVSSFIEYTVVDVAHVTKIDPAIPPNRACLIGCGVSTGEAHFLFNLSNSNCFPHKVKTSCSCHFHFDFTRDKKELMTLALYCWFTVLWVALPKPTIGSSYWFAYSHANSVHSYFCKAFTVGVGRFSIMPTTLLN